MVKTYSARAKINLMLCVTGKRQDGYHTINTLISFTDLMDELIVSDAADFILTIEGPFAAHAPAGEGNLVTKAARIMEEASGRRADVAVRLIKNVPAGAGFGGGSADAAAMMHALNERWGNLYSLEELQALGLKIGAELPVCLAGSAHFVSGIGDIVTPAKIPSFEAVVVWPGKPLATKDVFAVYSERFSKPVVMPDQVTKAWIVAQGNDLTNAAVQLQPLVKTALDATGGAMSGSGSAVFALCDDAKEKAAVLAASHPDWWVKATRVG